MGGFVLKPRISSTEKWSTFPLDAEQVHYLVVHKYVPYSAVNIEKEIIEDKNKVDVPLRLITVCQILWYFVGTIARASQGLTITVLELATMGFIVCTVGTYFFWFHKPMDIGRPFVLEPTATIQEILLEAGDRAQQPYKRTPLDFAGREEWWSWTLCWAYCFGIMRKLGIRLTTLERPITKIPDDFYPQLSHTASCILFVLQTGFAAVHLSGWSFQFPTHMERLLWHIATINIMIVILTFWVIHLFWWVLPLALRAQWGNISVGKGTTNDPPIEMPKDPVSIEDSENLPRSYLSRIVLVFRHAAARLRNNSYPHDPAQDVPLTALIPVLICCAIYMVSRAYIIIEGFINLRALPPGAYDSVDWTAFLPHF
ncbi:hypothetical protein MMC28_000271 [Mycoblastus sanguinarius]|nr:hypothetical protein [Mycoblastus sanguinarius]